MPPGAGPVGPAVGPPSGHQMPPAPHINPAFYPQGAQPVQQTQQVGILSDWYLNNLLYQLQSCSILIPIMDIMI